MIENKIVEVAAVLFLVEGEPIAAKGFLAAETVLN